MSAGRIHETAVIGDGAQLGAGVEIGPRVVVEDGATVGDGCRLAAGVVIKKGTTLGAENIIREYAVLGGDPQHTAYDGSETFLRIGRGNMIGEYVTIHRAYRAGGATTIGDGNYFMAYSHVGHDAVVGDRCVLTNYAALAGHTLLEDRVLFAGYAAVHQFVRVGTMAMLAGGTLLSKDALPYMMYLGSPGRLVSPNLIGLRRAGVPEDARTKIRQAFRLLTDRSLTLPEAVKRLRDELEPSPEIGRLLNFVERSERGVAI
ncbi:MAG: acyl-ACP--UDP-N-acetylglucosamine O-acyltransferase [Deltaproteobacteria bacterium]|nr:acyl-ACP--UDP-N-acetylglucosamine O-acyltransferase [Deltaproteobacteria bacterium]